MTWMCGMCGWENEQDDRVGLMEPICVKCTSRRGENERILDVAEKRLEVVEDEIDKERQSLGGLADHKQSLEEYISDIQSDISETIEMMNERRETLKDMQKEQEELMKVIETHCPTPVEERGSHKDQIKLPTQIICEAAS